MRFTTYSKYHPELADAVNLQGLLDQLTDFLLQSGLAGNAPSFWHDEFSDGDRSLEALRQAILQALMDSGQLTPDMLKVLRGESTGNAERDREIDRVLREDVRPDEEPAGVGRDQLQSGFERMVIGIRHIEAEHRCPCRLQGRAHLAVLVLHADAAEAQAPEAMADEHH